MSLYTNDQARYIDDIFDFGFCKDCEDDYLDIDSFFNQHSSKSELHEFQSPTNRRTRIHSSIELSKLNENNDEEISQGKLNSNSDNFKLQNETGSIEYQDQDVYQSQDYLTPSDSKMKDSKCAIDQEIIQNIILPTKKESLKENKLIQSGKYKRYRFRSRKAKNLEQRKYLTSQFQKNPNWSQNQISEIAQQLGLTFSQVYKWHWDKIQEMNQQYLSIYHKTCPFLVQPLDNSSLILFKVEKLLKQ